MPIDAHEMSRSPSASSDEEFAKHVTNGANILGAGKRSEQQWRVLEATLSSAADFVCTFDCAGRFRYVNQPLLDLGGKTSQEVHAAGVPCSVIRFILTQWTVESFRLRGPRWRVWAIDGKSAATEWLPGKRVSGWTSPPRSGGAFQYPRKTIAQRLQGRDFGFRRLPRYALPNLL
jgi:hypothetical protein